MGADIRDVATGFGFHCYGEAILGAIVGDAMHMLLLALHETLLPQLVLA